MYSVLLACDLFYMIDTTKILQNKSGSVEGATVMSLLKLN